MTAPYLAPRTRVRPTSRGLGVGLGATALCVTGIGFASPLLTSAGLVVLAAALVAALWGTITGIVIPRRAARVDRTVSPATLQVGREGTITAFIAATGGRLTARGVIRNLDISEQAASEVTGPDHHRATVARTNAGVRLRYIVEPAMRGRWHVGPIMVHSSDPWNLIATEAAIGTSHVVSVHPRVQALSAPLRALLGGSDHHTTGAQSSASDDASLREYRDGDDLRRVHWASSARRGSMVVRMNERQDQRPISVVMGLSPDAAATEWAISAAASVTATLHSLGHSATLSGGGLAHVPGQKTGAEATRAMLDSTVEIEPPQDSTDSRSFAASAARVSEASHAGAVTIAVLCDPTQEMVTTMCPWGEHRRAWAVLATSADTPSALAAAADRLTRAGWTCVVTSISQPFPPAWDRLVGASVAA
ncbi:DUF58 domain-containing protein [Demequina sp. B12]|uniref:DUF58 domain-containing protein n=1 Tax=Demequina sp. B12 TaxID=2992757 RepID=UPI00237B72C0|nr:DUF58 domain-containing protein [Demequina sp. B12]MDE0573339.1 DUF58 domain-containing protein [Demequina sp. B12]